MEATQCSTTNGKHNMVYPHSDYYSALERKEILTYTTTGMNLEDVKLNEMSVTKEDNNVWFHLYEVLRIVTFIELESRVTVAGELRGGRNGEFLVDRVSVLQDEKNYGDEWWWWLHIVNAFNTIELYT